MSKHPKMSQFTIPPTDHLFSNKIDGTSSYSRPAESYRDPGNRKDQRSSHRDIDQDTWERGTVTTDTTEIDGTQVQTNGRKFVSIDRPIFLTLLNLVQMMEPKMFLELNPLSLVGSIDPEIPEINGEALEFVNDMISAIWDQETDIAIPILYNGESALSARRGYTRPVQGLSVLTRMVRSSAGNQTERAMLDVKERYKEMEMMECMEAGRSLTKITLLGRLVTRPSQSSLRGKGRMEASDPDHEGRNRKGRKRRVHRRDRSSEGSVYSNTEREKEGLFSSLRKVLGIM
jgi:hypothetical protein